METYTATATEQQLDRIVEEICNDDVHSDGYLFVNIDDEDGFYVTGSVKVYGHMFDNRVSIDGHSYKEGAYFKVDGVRDIDIDAWMGVYKLDIDTNYIKKEILNNINY